VHADATLKFSGNRILCRLVGKKKESRAPPTSEWGRSETNEYAAPKLTVQYAQKKRSDTPGLAGGWECHFRLTFVGFSFKPRPTKGERQRRSFAGMCRRFTSRWGVRGGLLPRP
jgi:hypothetical protein